jgi:hypothetical protein
MALVGKESKRIQRTTLFEQEMKTHTREMRLGLHPKETIGEHEREVASASKLNKKVF